MAMSTQLLLNYAQTLESCATNIILINFFFFRGREKKRGGGGGGVKAC